MSLRNEACQVKPGRPRVILLWIGLLNSYAVSGDTGVAAASSGVLNHFFNDGVSSERILGYSVLGVATTGSEGDSYNSCECENQLFHFTLLFVEG